MKSLIKYSDKFWKTQRKLEHTIFWRKDNRIVKGIFLYRISDGFNHMYKRDHKVKIERKFWNFLPGYLAISALGHSLRSIPSSIMNVMLARKL